MELRPVDQYFERQEEPLRSCLQYLRGLIEDFHPDISETWKYGMPVYCYRNRMFCYLWTHKKYKQPYIGFVEGAYMDHPLLLAEKRARMRILLLDPEQDIPVTLICELLHKAIQFYS